MSSLKLDQFVEEAICDKYVVELSLGDLLRVSCSWRCKPWPMGCNLCHNLLSQHACTICLTFMHNMSNIHAQYVKHAQYV